ncbi:MAG: hypothetical protein JW791_04820 [Nanoarchaeota archaeon]|nr:hypothetical protein [Nanoarchaeota archaeon]
MSARLEDVIGEIVYRGDTPIRAAQAPLKGKSAERDSFYMLPGYLSDLLDNDGKIKDIKQNKQTGALEGISEESQRYINRLTNLGVFFENNINNRRISHTNIETDSLQVNSDEMGKVMTRNPLHYMLGELADYLSTNGKVKKEKLNSMGPAEIVNTLILGHNLGPGRVPYKNFHGLPGYFSNMYNIMKKYTNKSELKQIETKLKEGNLKPLLEMCKIISENLRNGFEDREAAEQKYVFDVTLDSVKKYRNTLKDERNEFHMLHPEETEERINKEVISYLGQCNNVMLSSGFGGLDAYAKQVLNDGLFKSFGKEEKTMELHFNPSAQLALDH